MKTCCTCKIEKEYSCFHKSSSLPHGLQRQCKECSHKKYKKTAKAAYQRSKKSRLLRVGEVADYQFNYYRKNMATIKERASKYYQDNKLKVRDWSREYMKNKKNTNPDFRLLCNLRTRINCAIKRGDKTARTMELIGCTIEQLKAHLQSKFTDGMSWDNRGSKGWHVDHIIPCASFDLSKPEEQRKCFHYTNLQPLWWRDNIIKSDKLCA